MALNWLRRQSNIVIPILGAKKLSQLQDNLGCLEFELTAEQRQRLDAVSRIERGFPHDFLAQDGVKEVIYGKTLALIDSQRYPD